MTLTKLIELLEDMRFDYGGDCEVRLMTQQNWPFENALYGVTCTAALHEESEMIVDDCDKCGRERVEIDEDGLCQLCRVEQNEDEDQIVYLVEGSQISYGNESAWDAARTY